MGSALSDNAPIVVVGAGPAGALMALYLARAGCEVTVYEARPDIRRAEISAGRSINLALATRGIVPLAEVGVIEQVDSITIPMRGRIIHADDGSRADGSQAVLQPYGTGPHEVIHSVSRRDLNAILIDAAEATGRVSFQFESPVQAIDLTANTLQIGAPEMSASAQNTQNSHASRNSQKSQSLNGTLRSVEFGTAICSDGAGSAIRASVVESAGGSVNVSQLGHGYKELRIPPAPGGGFQLDPNGLHIWPRRNFMLIALPNPQGDFTATLFAPHEGENSFASLTTPEAVSRFFEEHFGEVAALVPDIVDQFFTNPEGRLATMRCSGWHYQGKAVLVGDSAHAIVPFHGQGMNLAMESVRALDRQLREQPDDLASAFAAFEAERKPNAEAIADMALDNYIEMRSGVIDRDYLLKRELALKLQQHHPERFSPRYNMVMFSTMPYAEAAARAARQDKIMTELTAGCTAVADVDMDRAAGLVANLEPLPQIDPLARPVSLSL